MGYMVGRVLADRVAGQGVDRLRQHDQLWPAAPPPPGAGQPEDHGRDHTAYDTRHDRLHRLSNVAQTGPGRAGASGNVRPRSLRQGTLTTVRYCVTHRA